MTHYKIKNITNRLPKRHIEKDSVLKIEYHIGFQKKYKSLKPNEEMVLTCKKLPVSVHQLRMKNFIQVSEISENDFNRLQKPSLKLKKNLEKKVEELENNDESSDDDSDEDSGTYSSKSTNKSKRSTRKKTKTNTTTTTTTTIPPENVD